MTDRELLEQAARAIGGRLDGATWDEEMRAMRTVSKPTPYGLAWNYWNPLSYDGEALKLAVERRVFHENIGLFDLYFGEETAAGRSEEEATRRAIVRTVGALGRPALSWCQACGEGVTTFCRGKGGACAKGLKPAGKTAA